MSRIGLFALCIILFITYKYYDITKKKLTIMSEEALGTEIPNSMKLDYNTAIREFCIRTYNLESYNSQTYHEFIDLVNDFLSLYELILLNSSTSNKLYALLIDRRELIMNVFMSFQIVIPPEYNLKSAIDDLEMILNSYLENIININAEYINENGFNTNTTLLRSDELAMNRFTENIGSFSQY